MKTKMKSILGSALVALLLVFTNSCSDGDGNNTSNLPASVGSLHEILVVSNVDTFANSSHGKALIDVFEVEMLGLAISEKDFVLADVPEKAFNSVLQKHSKILLLNPKDLTVNKPNYQIIRNKWAKEQFIVRLNAANNEDLIKLIKTKGAEIKELYHEFEIQREAQRNWSKVNENFVSVLKKDFGVKMAVPKRFRLATQNEDFLWFRSETPTTSEGIMVYKETYTNDSTFTYDYIVNRRNEITKKHIPGPAEGSYMAVNTIFPKTQKTISIDGAYAVETRGLWKVENYFMGGSFISYTIYNEKRNEIITIEGFVHAPNEDKRVFMIDFEGILRSLQFAK